MPDFTNYDGRLEQMACYCEAMLDNIAKINNAYHDSVENAYTDVLPNSLIKWKGINQIGGKTVVFNQLIDLVDDVRTSGQVTYTTAGGIVTLSGTSSGGSALSFANYFNLTAGHKYCLKGSPSGASASTYSMRIVGVYDYGSGVIFTAASTTTAGIVIGVADTVDATGVVFKPQLFDLTLMFGAGNEPTTVDEVKAILAADFYEYNAGELLSAGVTTRFTQGFTQVHHKDFVRTSFAP